MTNYEEVASIEFIDPNKLDQGIRVYGRVYTSLDPDDKDGSSYFFRKKRCFFLYSPKSDPRQIISSLNDGGGERIEERAQKLLETLESRFLGKDNIEDFLICHEDDFDKLFKRGSSRDGVKLFSLRERGEVIFGNQLPVSVK